MGRILKRPAVIAGLSVALLAGAAAFVLMTRASKHLVAQTEAGPSDLIIVPQPTSPLQIASVTPATPQPPATMPAVTNLKAWQVVLKNTTTHNVLAYSLRMPMANGPQEGGFPRAGATHSRFAASMGAPPLLASGATATEEVHFAWDSTKGPVAILVDFVFLDDGTAYGPNASGAEQTLVDDVTDRQALETFLLQMLQSEGAQATEDYMEKELAYYKDLAPKVMMPNAVR